MRSERELPGRNGGLGISFEAEVLVFPVNPAIDMKIKGAKKAIGSSLKLHFNP